MVSPLSGENPNFIPDTARKNCNQMALAESKPASFFKNYIGQYIYIFSNNSKHGFIKVANAAHAEQLHNLQGETGAKFLSMVERAKQVLGQGFYPRDAAFKFFEMTGHGMSNSTANAIESGDTLTTKTIDRLSWQKQLKLLRVYAIKNQIGMRVASIKSIDAASGKICFGYLNPDKAAYPDFTLHFTEIESIYQVISITKKR